MEGAVGQGQARMTMERKGGSDRTAREKAARDLRPGLGFGPALSNPPFRDDGNMLLVLFHNVARSHLRLLLEMWLVSQRSRILSFLLSFKGSRVSSGYCICSAQGCSPLLMAEICSKSFGAIPQGSGHLRMPHSLKGDLAHAKLG